MTALVDSLTILLLLALGLARLPTSSPEALPALAWFAFTTPLLVRSDLARRRLPNLATLPGLAVVAASAVVALAVGRGGQDPGLALVTTATIAACGAALARAGSIGLGDVKLAAALAGSLALADPAGLVSFSGVAALAGLAAAGVTRARRSRRGIPFGPCLLLGYWTAVALA